jgi:hypothetical protein
VPLEGIALSRAFKALPGFHKARTAVKGCAIRFNLSTAQYTFIRINMQNRPTGFSTAYASTRKGGSSAGMTKPAHLDRFRRANVI